MQIFTGGVTLRLDFRRLPGPVFDPPRKMSAGSFSRTAAGNRGYPITRVNFTSFTDMFRHV